MQRPISLRQVLFTSLTHPVIADLQGQAGRFSAELHFSCIQHLDRLLIEHLIRVMRTQLASMLKNRDSGLIFMQKCVRNVKECKKMT